jgi:hypothetical protein
LELYSATFGTQYVVFILGKVLNTLLQSIKCIINSRNIIIDYQHLLLKIQGLSKKIYERKYAFVEIKSLIFFDQKEHIVDYGESWKTSLKITDKQGKTIYFAAISKALNYFKLQELCTPFFEIDYIILNESNQFLFFPEGESKKKGR